MRGLYELKEILCRELEEISSKNELSAGDLETVHKLTDTIKNIDKIEMFDSESGYSGNSYANRGEHYVRGHYSRENGSSNRGGTYRGNSSRGGYSRSGGVMEQMERLLEEANTEKERRAIEKCMMQLENA